jgi:hypothetical protein
MTDAILPRLPDLVGAAAQKLIEERPAARPHIVAGRWGDLLAQQKAEAALALKRLASEVQAARVGQAEGRALYDLLVSEFDAIITPEPSKAVGTILLDRNYGDGTVTMPGGIIPKGTRFRKVADASTSPPVRGADYVSVTPVFVEPAPGNYTQSISVRIEAAQAGTAANAQPWEETCFALADALFDSDIAVNEGAAAGGSDGFSTARLRSLARALSLGQYGPVALALVAGALSTPGVTRVAACEYDQANARGVTSLWIADDSWCWSRQLQDTAQQVIQDGWLGFGCSCLPNKIENTRVSVTASIMLRDKRHLADTLEINHRVRAAVKSYFDDRPDFYTWKNASLRGAIVQSDRRILACQSVAVKDVGGNTLSEPSALFPATPATQLYHYDVDATRLTPTYLTPG